jgi:hypothetical protein
MFKSNPAAWNKVEAAIVDRVTHAHTVGAEVSRVLVAVESGALRDSITVADPVASGDSIVISTTADRPYGYEQEMIRQPFLRPSMQMIVDTIRKP